MSQNGAPAPAPAASFMNELRKIPPVTRFVVGCTLAVTGPVMLEMLSPYKVLYVWKFVKQLQLWRIPTSFFFGGTGLPFLFDIMMLYRNSNTLEETWYHNRSPEYAYQLLLSCVGILLLNVPLGSFIHYRAMLVCITYLTSRLSPNSPVSIFGVVSVKAIYFPFVLVGLDLLNGGLSAAAVAVTGLIVGHAWWMLEWRDGSNGGTGSTMGKAPGWLVNLVGSGEAPGATAGAEQPARRPFGSASAPAGRGLNDGGRGASSPPGHTHPWGQGQKLGSD